MTWPRPAPVAPSAEELTQSLDGFWSAARRLLPLKNWRRWRRSGQNSRYFGHSRGASRWTRERDRTACSTRRPRPRWPRSKSCSRPNIRSTANARRNTAPRWGATRTTPTTAATPGIWRRSRRPSSISNWRSRCDRAPGCRRRRECALSRTPGRRNSSRRRFRPRRYVHAHRAGLHALRR